MGAQGEPGLAGYNVSDTHLGESPPHPLELFLHAELSPSHQRRAMWVP